MKIYFPKDVGQKYYSAHYRFLFNLFAFLKLDIELCEPEPAISGFVIRVGEKRVLIDFGDFLELAEDAHNFDACFKFHYSREYCSRHKNVYPFGPTSFYDWEDYFMLEKQIKYRCNTNLVLNNQKARRGAKYRRRDVRRLLESKYGNLVDIKITDPLHFWLKINDCLVSICVPGQREDILDRGQFQQIAFGACTVSPRLNIVLPHMRELEPGVHYVECASDYSDLIDKIEWCKDHRAVCREIGQSAKNLFSETSVPNAIWYWMYKALEEEAL